jgi:hypothetical protein
MSANRVCWCAVDRCIRSSPWIVLSTDLRIIYSGSGPIPVVRKCFTCWLCWPPRQFPLHRLHLAAHRIRYVRTVSTSRHGHHEYGLAPDGTRSMTGSDGCRCSVVWSWGPRLRRTGMPSLCVHGPSAIKAACLHTNGSAKSPSYHLAVTRAAFKYWRALPGNMVPATWRKLGQQSITPFFSLRNRPVIVPSGKQ